jgi:hypothetical protein
MSEPKPGTPAWHYANGVDLLTCIGSNKDNPRFDAVQAGVLAEAATAQALLGLLKLLIDLGPYALLRSSNG